MSRDDPYRPLFHEHTQAELEKLRVVRPAPGYVQTRALDDTPWLPPNAGISPDRKTWFWQVDCTVCGGPVYVAVAVEGRWHAGNVTQLEAEVRRAVARWHGLGCDACSEVCKEDVEASLQVARGGVCYINRWGLRQRTKPEDGANAMRQVPPRAGRTGRL